MINAPDTPSVGQIFTSAGISWRWDGVKWVAVPLSGVVDGSNAAAGQVGEYQAANRTGASQVNLTPLSTFVAIMTLALTAGDWDCWAEGVLLPVAAAGTLAVYLCVGAPVSTPADNQGEAALAVNAWVGAAQSMAIAPIRLSLNAPATVTLYGYSTISCTGWGKIAARRRR